MSLPQNGKYCLILARRPRRTPASTRAVTDVPQHPSLPNPHSGPLCPSRSSLGRSRCIQAELFSTETKLESQRAPIRPSLPSLCLCPRSHPLNLQKTFSLPWLSPRREMAAADSAAAAALMRVRTEREGVRAWAGAGGRGRLRTLAK